MHDYRSNPRLITLAVSLLFFACTLTAGVAHAGYRLELAADRDTSRGAVAPTKPNVTKPFSRRMDLAPTVSHTIAPTPTPEPVAATPEPTAKPEKHAKPQKKAQPKGSVRDRVLATWPGDDVWVDRTVSCESGYNPDAVGGGGNNYHGLFQMGPWARSHYGDPLDQTVEEQTQAAWQLLNDESSSQWSCSPYGYNP